MVATLKRGQLLLPTKFAFRELRNGIRGFRIFIACLILGVSTIAGIGTLNESIEGGLKRDGRKLLGGDVSIRLLHLPAKKEHIKYFKTASDFSEIIEMRAMARNIASTGVRTIVELKAVDDAYPLVGNFMLKGKISLNTALSMKDGLWGVVADASLQKKLNLAVGDILELGDSRFRLMGIIKKVLSKVFQLL